MHIAFDARAWQWMGIGRYIRHMLRSFAGKETGHTFIVFVPEGTEGAIAKECGLLGDRFRIIPVEPSYYSIPEQTRLLAQLNRINADLFHFTHFNVPLLFRKPFVVTIHDTTRFVFPGQTKQSLLQQIGYEAVFASAVRRAARVIAVSHFTKDELLAIGLGEDQTTHVIAEGVDKRFFVESGDTEREEVEKLLGTRDPYILFVGVWMSHKNILRLIDAFCLIRGSRPDLKLVITGRAAPGYVRVREYARAQGIEDAVLFPGVVSNDVLPALYAGAQCFVFPSLYEGFGLPVIEAAAAGTPVVTSNVSALPEVMQDVAVYVNPEHTQSIARGIERVLSDPELRASLEKQGKERARDFRWQQAAQDTLRVYEMARN